MTWYPTASTVREPCHRNWATNSHFPRVSWLMVLSCQGVSELGKIQSWEALGPATGDTRLARWISTSYQQQLFLQTAFFFQWKRCPQLCQQDFWADYCSPGNRQEAPSLPESVGSPPPPGGLAEDTGTQPHHKRQSQSLGFDN